MEATTKIQKHPLGCLRYQDIIVFDIGYLPSTSHQSS